MPASPNAPRKPRTTVGPLATPEGRLSFPHLDAPETGGQYPSNRYIATIVMPKTADFTALKEACLKTCMLTFPNIGITSLAQIRLPFRDGDEKTSLDGYAGMVYLKCKSKNKPPVFGPNREDYVGPIKGGDYVKFSVTAGAWKQQVEAEVAAALRSAGKFVVTGQDEQGRPMNWRPAATFYLNAVQWRREGAAFGGGGGNPDVFDDAENAADAAALFGG